MSELGPVSIQLFGQFRVAAAGHVLSIPSEKLRTLLAYAALRPRETILRDELIAALWPDSDEAAARPRLRRMIWKLRRFLRPLHPSLSIETTHTTLLLKCPPDAVDAVRFKRLTAHSGGNRDALREAVELYHGDLLAGSSGEWIENDRFHYQALFVRAVKQLAEIFITQQDGTTAMQYARRAVELDRTDEDATYAFMEAALLAGEPTAALAQYDILARALRDDIGVRPSSHVTALFEQIRFATPRKDISDSTRQDLLVPASRGSRTEAIGLIGRSTELQRLLQALHTTRETRSVAVVIEGPAGVGKTRLADAVIADAHRSDMLVYKGRCSDVPNPPPYHPVVEALWPRLAGVAAQQSPVLATLISTLAPGAGGRRSRSTTGLGILDAALVSESLLRILPSADESPALLVFDDIHRADDATWTWLNSLIRRLDDFHVCVIFTARIGETEEQDQRVAHLALGGVEVVALEVLGAEDVKTLVSAALGVPRAPRMLSEEISRHIGGNPLEVLEAIRLLKERGLLQRSGGTWSIDPRASEVLSTLASSRVNALVQQRVVLIPKATRDVLSAAAILGMEMSAEHLRTLVRVPERGFLAHIERLIQHRLLLSRTSALLKFPHEEIRRTVLDQINPLRRRWLHGRAAQLLSRLQSTRPEDLYWHYHGAGILTGALSAAASAGDSSYALGEHASAIAWYDRALAAISRNAKKSDLRLRLALELKLEAALDRHGNRPRQLLILQSIAETAAGAGYLGELCEALIRRSLCLTRMNRYHDAVDAADQAMEVAHSRSDLQRQAHAYRALGLAHETFDGAEAIRFLNEALRLFRQLGTTTDESLTLSELATSYERLGDTQAALQALDRAAGLLSPDATTRAYLLARRASVLLWTGRLSETYAAIQDSLTLLRRSGDRVAEARVLRVLGDAHTHAGRYRDALAAATQALRIAKQADDTRLMTSILNSLLVGVYRRLGLTHRGHTSFIRIVQLIGTNSQSESRAPYEDSLSSVYLHAGLWEQARCWAERALASMANVKYETYVSSEIRLHLGQALLELGTPNAAIEHLRGSLMYYRSAGELPYQAFAASLLAVAASEVGNRGDAEEYLRKSTRLLHRIDVLQDSHLIHWLHGHVWKRLGHRRKAARAFRAAYAELNRVAASLGGPLRRRFLSLPFQRRVLEAIGVNPPSDLPAKAVVDPFPQVVLPEPLAARSVPTRRQAVLHALTNSPKKPTRRALAAALGVTPRTITNDIAALRRAGHQIETLRITH